MNKLPINTPDIKWIMTMLDNPDSWLHDRGFEPMKDILIRHVQSYYANEDQP